MVISTSKMQSVTVLLFAVKKSVLVVIQMASQLSVRNFQSYPVDRGILAMRSSAGLLNRGDILDNYS